MINQEKLKKFNLFRFLNYYRLLGFLFFLAGLELTFKNNGFILLKYLGIFLIFVGAYDVITGKSMKKSAMLANAQGEKKSTDSNGNVSKEAINKEEEINTFNKKSYIKKLFKSNAVVGIVILILAVILFRSSNVLTKKIFSYKDVNTKTTVPNYFNNAGPNLGINTAKIEPIIETVNLSNTYLKNQIVVKFNSIEKTPKSTYVNITIENNSKKGIQLSNIEKFEVIDNNNNIYKLSRVNCGYRIFDPLEPSSSTDFKLAFEPCDTSTKITKFKGQFWTFSDTKEVIQEVPFEMVLSK